MPPVDGETEIKGEGVGGRVAECPMRMVFKDSFFEGVIVVSKMIVC